jgi:hypothetical protein
MRSLLLLTIIAACSPAVARFQDGPTGDAAPDVPTHGMVKVTVYDPNNTGSVVAGVPVVFVEADDTLVAHPVTDQGGVATADVHIGASATVVITTQGSTQMTTLLGLKPGDDIILGPRSGTPTDAGNFTVSFATYPGASNYTVYGPCGGTNSATSPVVLPMQSDCKKDTMDLMVVAYDVNNNPFVYLTKSGVTFAAGGSTAVTGTYLGIQNATLSYTNVPAAVTNVYPARDIPDNYGFARGGGGAPAGGTFSTTLPAPQGAKALVITEIDNSTGANQTFNEVIDGNTLTHGMDVGATALPWIGTVALDAANHKITVPIDPTGTSGDMPDAFFAETAYSRTVDQTNTSYAWLVLGPTPGDMTLPTLPPEVGDVMPKATDSPGTSIAVMVESDAIASYDVIRQDIFLTVTAVNDPIHPSANRTRQSVNVSRP